MTVLETLNNDMKAAMKAKEKERLSVIRMLKSALQNEQIHLGRPLDADEELTVLAREMKQRRDSLAEFDKAGRKELVEKTKAEMQIVAGYLPKQLSPEEITTIVQDAIATTGASSPKEFGKVMGAVMPKVKGRADGNLVNETVKRLLQN